MRLKTVLPAFVLLVVGCNESVFDIDSKTSAVYTGLSLKLPLPSGYQWRVNTEAKSGSCGSGCTDSDHVNTYSIDFGRNIELFDGSHPPRFGDGVVDLFAAAEGDVVEVVNSGCRDYDVDDKGNCNPGAYSRTCRVIIDHGNGYKTRYLHFTNGSIAVTTTPPNNHVTQGQYLGKMGTTGCSTGTHLHFDVTHNGNRATTNPELAGLSLEGLDFIDDFKSGNYRPSKNGFTYNAYPDFPSDCRIAR
jgi:murein DD-endopeptidase MepM/ murein hydrolase activator NlpD